MQMLNDIIICHQIVRHVRKTFENTDFLLFFVIINFVSFNTAHLIGSKYSNVSLTTSNELKVIRTHLDQERWYQYNHTIVAMLIPVDTCCPSKANGYANWFKLDEWMNEWTKHKREIDCNTQQRAHFTQWQKSTHNTYKLWKFWPTCCMHN